MGESEGGGGGGGGRGRMEERLLEAAIRGSKELFNKIREEDGMILEKMVMGCFKRNPPLHVAASRGDTEFVRYLLTLSEKKLAQVRDSQHRSALHVASAEGHVQVVKILIQANPHMCMARDREGRNPLHLAAMNGRVRVLPKLIRTAPHAARARVDGGDTILHLCVKYNQLRALLLLLRKIPSPDFVNAKDDDGNTILHLAVSAKQLRIVKHVLTLSNIDPNATNESGQTAMDILFLGGNRITLESSSVHSVDEDQVQESDDQDDENSDREIEDFLQQAKAKKAKDLVHGEWLTKKRETLMIVASLIAAMAFQAGVNPPGGAWQDSKFGKHGHRAGEAIMAYHYKDSYPWFLRFNTVAFVASLSTILLLISGLRFTKRAYIWGLTVIMLLTITSTAVSYAISIVWVTPLKDRTSLSHTLAVAIFVWCSVMVMLMVLHTIRLIQNGFAEKYSRNAAINRINHEPKDHAINTHELV